MFLAFGVGSLMSSSKLASTLRSACTYNCEEKEASMRNVAVQVLVAKEDGWFVAKGVLTNVASQGNGIKAALDNPCEVLELYFDGSDGLA